ncbi:YdcF family protein [Chitinophaga vietnamensis]|uniref:YdcF family protein n=1 Tax=Chitinophaga vietnamensis TaxID=2593957 RepID=UPI001178AF9A|nr:YdcF family protein [Chitinophaga vietnamensis]
MYFLKKCLLIILLMMGLSVQAQLSYPDPHYNFLHSASVVQDRNFYLFTLLEQMPGVAAAVAKAPALRKLADEYRQRLSVNVSSTADAAVAPLMFSDEAIAEVGKSLPAVLEQQQQLAPLMQAMRSSGLFQLYEGDSDTLLLTRAWQDAAHGVNYILKAYTTNKGFRYPNIDSAAFYVRSPAYAQSVQELLKKAYRRNKRASLFFQPSLDAAIALLLLNRHDEAARYEPLSVTNKDAYTKIKSIDWTQQRYSAILILGAGPGNGDNISDAGKQRCAYGVARYRKGEAPFIIVSGGHVHPFGTPFSEGVEMKKYLVNVLHVPADAVIVEPYARHTTTNIRNAVRIAFRSGLPMDKRMLCVSDAMHLTYVASPIFDKRCTAELDYLPMKEIAKEEDNVLSFVPDIRSLFADARDPLDP